MQSSNSDDVRINRLSVLFNGVLSGKRPMKSTRDGKLFIESVCIQPDPATCAHKILSNPSGLTAIQSCIRFDTSPEFINGTSTSLLLYLQEPSLAAINSGTVLAQILNSIADPPFFFDAFTASFRDLRLNPRASNAYAWLLLQLISLPGKPSSNVLLVAKSPDILNTILESPDGDTRIIGQKIKHVLSLGTPAINNNGDVQPGGRHDNDFSDHRKISIMPTADELLSRDRPFLRVPEFYLRDAELETSRLAIHIDNQFRLLREDMVGEIREEIQKLQGIKSGRHKGLMLDDLRLVGVDMGIDRKRQPWGIILQCRNGLPQLSKIKPEKRKDYLSNNRHILRNGTMACLLLDNEPVAFPTTHRNENELLKSPANIVIQFQDDTTVSYALSKLKTASSIRLVQLDTAVFAFEPFLQRLQEIKEVSLSKELLHWQADDEIDSPSFWPSKIANRLEKSEVPYFKYLEERTGKSFIGALSAKVLHDFTQQTIIILAYTNHALDQFLEELIDIGIPTSSLIRLGSKSTDKTKLLTLREQGSSKLNPSQWDQINKLEQKLQQHETRLKDAFMRYRANIQKGQLIDYLEFAPDNLPFFEAFSVPVEGSDGMTRVGKKGKAVNQYYLLDRWLRGNNAGIFQHMIPSGASPIWNMIPNLRDSTSEKWRKAIVDDLVAEICRLGKQINLDQAELALILSQRDTNIIKAKRIIACTTTGAAKYAASIQAASPGIILVEEAGEILESHILTALAPQTEQLIMIGDHKQLRPKCSYDLSVEQGDGFDLNRSLFERLILAGFPHTTLQQQHRMRPEISSIIRHLTYPELTDADTTSKRPDLRGFCNNVMFVNHKIPESELKVQEMRDVGSTSSKQNDFEGQMILKCVRYLAQQGYGSDKLVVLTPYLGQLKLLRDQLANENDPILNDLDKYDLIRAGLLTDTSSKTSKPSLRISTIDNYQGEESDIVLVSLTRSNKTNDIGFMAAPERLNVLLSRARNGLIIIGNSDTFINARKGKAIWKKFFDHMVSNGHIYEGFPVKCEKHPDRMAILSLPEHFEANCPDGGCREACPLACLKCERERKDAEKKAKKALLDQQRREERDRRHLAEISKIQDQIDQITQSLKDIRLDSEQANILAQKRQDLEKLKELANKPPSPQSHPTTAGGIEPQEEIIKEHTNVSQTPKHPPNRAQNLQKHLKICLSHNVSPSKTEWQRQKDQENAHNPAIDKIMDMIGLDKVKSQVLNIKSKVDTSKRQRTDLRRERFGLVLLGNPGTGKTTVARHYADVLTSLEVLPGDVFVETTGSRLAHEGVNEVKKHLKSFTDNDGGVYFIDEAYQLAEGHSPGGKTVLDFLLAEIENLVGKVVFIFAGYRKQMEKFFEHNPGFSSRIPYTLHFEDYEDDELLRMLQYLMDKFYNSSMEVQDGIDGLYMRIAVRRLGRGRGRDGFGNARDLENLFAKIRERQSARLSQERRDGILPNDYLLTKEDIIGPDPSKAILKSRAWDQLQKLTGLKAVKKMVSVMIDLIKTNYQLELQERPIIQLSLNRVFLGSPGTGKTTVAKLYGEILADIGLLSNGEVVVKSPADFIGNVIGQSESNTKAILATTVGKILVIDEAYMLSPGRDGSAGGSDIYKTAVIDTIVAEVQSVPGEDRCVLLLGYEDKMVEMFQNCNEGLTRRFDLKEAFRFEDFNDSELEEILQFKLKKQGLGATSHAKSVAIATLSRARKGLNFGNGGDVENLISKAKTSYQSRQSSLPVDQRSYEFLFEPQDFDPDFNRASNAETNLQELFHGVIGCEMIIAKLEGYLRVARGMRAQGLDPQGHIPMNFIFKGPPGTGKTTTARKLGQVFYDLGFLSHVEVVECSATDMIGQYVGHTGPKVITLLERGLGKVLFIDEAYQLGQGYDNDMNRFLEANEGLSSRFADDIVFPALSPTHCLQLLGSKLQKSDISIPALKDPLFYHKLLNHIDEMSKLPGWGNARDIETLAKRMARIVYQDLTEKVDHLVVSEAQAMDCVQDMLSDRRSRSASVAPPSNMSNPQLMINAPEKLLHTFITDTSSKTCIRAPEKSRDGNSAPLSLDESNEIRDKDVPDAIWEQLQKDKKMAESQAKWLEEMLHRKEDEVLAAEAEEEKIIAEAQLLQQTQAKDNTERLELLRLREEARIHEIGIKMAREKLEEELEKHRQEEQERRRKEMQVQTKLKKMGVCCMGYRWIKQSSGYRCSAGAHFVSDEQIERFES
ncbi:hypothetical protein B7494_g3417 [Chlorociboria aeruginascens]|nr:hypothetical protein B7494_g3417 [Chlorociboria aeruginascens]